jgi:hydroxypyruvate reductase
MDAIERGIQATIPAAVLDRKVSVSDGILDVDGNRYDLDTYDEVVLLGGGNAAAQIAAEFQARFGEILSGGAVITDDPTSIDGLRVLPGSHPLPDEQGSENTRKVLHHAKEADENTLVLAIVAGGASALLAAPTTGISIDDLRATTTALLESGAEIQEINTVRRHLSDIKGGQLAQAAKPADVVGLLFSDVVGNDPSAIGSGPTVPDETSYADAVEVVERYELDVPDAVSTHLEAGVEGAQAETPGKNDPSFDRTTNVVLVDGFDAIEAARDAVEERGFTPLVLSSRIRGEAREAGTFHVALAEECRVTGYPVRPAAALISGGETTVTVRGDGVGGPNQEFALAVSLELSATDIVVTAVDTDGIDGATDAAGAIIDSNTATPDAVAREALDRNDVEPFLAKKDALVQTGPTGTNVSDLRVVVIGDE